MNTQFYKNLVLGRRYEERIATLLEDEGFSVLRIGNWKLPVDLLVWSNDITFFVEVKFRAGRGLKKKELEYASEEITTFMGEEDIPVHLITLLGREQKVIGNVQQIYPTVTPQKRDKIDLIGGNVLNVILQTIGLQDGTTQAGVWGYLHPQV